MEPWFWTIVLLGVAMLLGTLELFLPSGGFLGLLAACSLIGSIVFAFHFSPSLGVGYLVLLMIVVPLAIWQMLRLWPHTFIGKRIMLRPEDDPALQPDEERLHLKGLVGRIGVARTRMMPAGTIEIDGERLDALSDGVPIDPGDPVQVIRVDGINITVRRIERNEPVVKTSSLPEEAEPVIEDPFAP